MAAREGRREPLKSRPYSSWQKRWPIHPRMDFDRIVPLPAPFDKALPHSPFNPMLGPLHEDYQDSAIQLQTRHKNSPLWIYVVTAEDLAISKLGRFGEQDRQDILTLLRKNCMTVDSFYTKASEAINYYVGNTSVATGNLEHVIRLYRE